MSLPGSGHGQALLPFISHFFVLHKSTILHIETYLSVYIKLSYIYVCVCVYIYINCYVGLHKPKDI